MGLATARALARAGRDVVALRAVRGRPRPRLEPRRLADRPALVSRTSAGCAWRRRPIRSGASSRSSSAGRCSTSPARSTSATGRRTATRSRRAGCRSRCSTPPRSNDASRSGSSRASAVSSRRTAASSSPTSRCRRSATRRRRPVRTSASGCPSIPCRRTATAWSRAACERGSRSSRQAPGRRRSWASTRLRRARPPPTSPSTSRCRP